MFFGKKQQSEMLAVLEQGSDRPRYWQMVWRRFRKNKPALWAFRGVVILLLIALLNPFIANDKPIYAKINGQNHFPVFKEIAVDMGWSKWGKELVNTDWVKMNYESVIRAMIPYNANNIDKKNTGKSPFAKQDVSSLRFRHWLGTDDLGRDMAAGMVQGTRISLMVGIVSMLIATIIGLFFGAVAGYFGDQKMKLSRIRLLLNVVGLLLAIYYAFGIRTYLLTESKKAMFY